MDNKFTGKCLRGIQKWLAPITWVLSVHIPMPSIYWLGLITWNWAANFLKKLSWRSCKACYHWSTISGIMTYLPMSTPTCLYYCLLKWFHFWFMFIRLKHSCCLPKTWRRLERFLSASACSWFGAPDWWLMITSIAIYLTAVMMPLFRAGSSASLCLSVINK